jgi:hypothetical protein
MKLVHQNPYRADSGMYLFAKSLTGVKHLDADRPLLTCGERVRSPQIRRQQKKEAHTDAELGAFLVINKLSTCMLVKMKVPGIGIINYQWPNMCGALVLLSEAYMQS